MNDVITEATECNCGRFPHQNYEGSDLEKSVNRSMTKQVVYEFLMHFRMQSRIHTRHGNQCQIIFFNDAISHAEKLLREWI